MEVKRPFDRGWGKTHPKCKKEIDEYEEIIDKKGVKTLQKKGTLNFYDEIQARGECVEIKDVIKRYKINLRELPAVEISETIEDMNNMPTDWTEAQNVIARTKNTFSMLPKEERELFNNNPEEFVKAIIEKNEKFNTLKTKVNKVNENMPTNNDAINPGVATQTDNVQQNNQGGNVNE